jgi:hypothetical protein
VLLIYLGEVRMELKDILYFAQEAEKSANLRDYENSGRLLGVVINELSGVVSRVVSEENKAEHTKDKYVRGAWVNAERYRYTPPLNTH